MDKELQPLARQIGAALRAGRQVRDFRQREVAEQVGISVEGYARMERGAMLPSVGTLWKLRAALGLSGEAVFGAEISTVAKTATAGTSSEGRDIIRLVLGADRRTQRRILVVVRAMIPPKSRERR